MEKQRFNCNVKQALSVQNPRPEKGDVKDDIYERVDYEQCGSCF